MPTSDTAAGATPGAAQIPAPTGSPSFNATPAGGIDVAQITDPATRSLIQSLSTEISGYQSQVATIGNNYSEAAKQLAAMDSTDPNYASQVRLVDSLANSWSAVQNNYARAEDTRAQTIQKAVDNRWIQGPQQDLWSAQAQNDRAQAEKAKSDTDIAKQNAGAQRDLLIAQSTSATATAALTNAQASNLVAKTPAEIQQLQASANQATANAHLLNAQATGQTSQNQITSAQASVAPRAAEATTGTLEANQGIAQRNLANMPTPEQAAALTQNTIGQGQANIGATQAGTASTQATTAATEATTGKAILGPAFGLQQQLDAIKQIAQNMRTGQIPVGADPQAAIDNMNQMLNQYLQATVAGTTVQQASKDAQSAIENIRQQNITQRQQDTTLQGQAMSGAAGAYSSTIGPLIGAVKDLPAGSTALGPAAAALYAPFLAASQGNLARGPAQVPTPALPPFLQNFAGGQTPQQGHSITINIGGSGANAPAQANGAGALPVEPTVGAPAPGAAPTSTPYVGNDTGGGPGMRMLPQFMQGSQVADTDFVNSLWGRAA